MLEGRKEVKGTFYPLVATNYYLFNEYNRWKGLAQMETGIQHQSVEP
jgi:hypothetical protein